MQIKAMVRHHLTPVKMPIIKNSTNNNTGKSVEKDEHSYTVSGIVNRCSHCGKQHGGTSKS